MPRNRTPSSILELKGAYNKDPQRRRVDEADAPTFKKTAPSYFTADEKRVWREMVRTITPGVLTLGDRFVLEQTVLLLCEMREYREAFQSARHKVLMSCFSRLGLTPADRSKIVIPKMTTNKFDRTNRYR